MDDATLNSHAETWQKEGWVLVPGLIPAGEIDAAVEDLWEIYPRPEEFHDPANTDVRAAFSGMQDERKLFARGAKTEGVAFRNEQFLGHASFPFAGSGLLNKLFVHRNLRRFASLAIGDDDIRIYQMSTWAKYTGVTDYEQPLHTDLNHSVVPPRMEPGYWHMEGFLYLSDVYEGVAPTRVVPRSDSRGLPPVRRGPDVQELVAHEVAAAGPRGSYLAYRPDIFHRGVNLTEPGGSRFLANISFKPASADWIQYHAVQSRNGVPAWRKFVAQADVDELALFGVPRPGHHYWNEATLAAMAEWQPELNLSPWREALG